MLLAYFIKTSWISLKLTDIQFGPLKGRDSVDTGETLGQYGQNDISRLALICLVEGEFTLSCCDTLLIYYVWVVSTASWFSAGRGLDLFKHVYQRHIFFNAAH